MKRYSCLSNYSKIQTAIWLPQILGSLLLWGGTCYAAILTVKISDSSAEQDPNHQEYQTCSLVVKSSREGLVTYRANAQWKIFGASSIHQTKKRNIRLKFKKKKAPSADQFFPGTNDDLLQRLVLRGLCHDSWAVSDPTWRNNARYVNDYWVNATLREMGWLVPEMVWAELWINNDYRGLYTLAEFPDEHFAARHFDGTPADFDVFNGKDLKSGSVDNYTHLLALLNSPRADTPAVRKRISSYLNVNAFFDYFLVHLYMNNIDWPHKNYRLIGKKGPSPQFTFVPWDAEIGFFKEWPSPRNPKNLSAIDFNLLEDSQFLADNHGPGCLYRHLTKIPTFQAIAKKRFKEHLSPGGILSAKKSAERYRSALEEIAHVLPLEWERWALQKQKETLLVNAPHHKLPSTDGWIFSMFFAVRNQSIIGKTTELHHPK